jgi:outer membrane receptor protein involved in Fe transport
MDYGFNLDSVVFLDRLNFLSPFARLSYDLGSEGAVEFAYSSGMPAADLLSPSGGREQSIQQDLLGLAMFPRVSLRGGRARVQRSENFELGFRQSFGDTSFNAALYQERVGDLAMSVAAAPGLLSASDLLPDISSNSSIVNAGNYRARGLMTGVSQAFWDAWSVGLTYGYGTTLERAGGAFRDALSLRQAIRPVDRHWTAVRLSGLVPGAGTRFTAAYVWTPANGLVPMHAFLTQRQQPQIGLNLQIRQPLPGFGGMPGRLEATAELRNLISQGYVPIQSADGRSLVLVPFPKALRGGLSFIF